MNLKSIISSTLIYLSSLPKRRLLEVIEKLRNSYLSLEKENALLRSEIASLKQNALSEKVKKVNQQSNKPSSKQAAWEESGVGNDQKGKKKGRGKKGRKGSGNQTKNKALTKIEEVSVEYCSNCGEDLSLAPTLSSVNTRSYEDLPGLPTTRISVCLKDFFTQSMSTAGISAHLIKLGKILKPVQENILKQINEASIVHGDETGWKVGGKLWWMWVVGDKYWAYYTIDKSRGKEVVRRMLGEVFLGVLVVDGWKAYLSLECEQQSCMAHLLRKIRKLHQAFPNLRTVFQFYIKFRKILRDGERLQAKREELGEQVFQRRLKKLHLRLDKLLNWSNPNDILKQIIKKCKNQRKRTLTFVEHPGVPCHNNYAEYLIRIGVLKRKVSFGSKSAEGAEAYATLLSIYTTCKLQGIPFLDFLEKSLKNYIKTGQPLFITEYLRIQDMAHKKAA